MEVSDLQAPYITKSMNPARMVQSIKAFHDPDSLLTLLKKMTEATDDTIANWLNINVKTYRSYRKLGAELKPVVREQLMMLMALASHGLSVFGNSTAFNQWLFTENFMLDKQKPADLLMSNSGIRLIDDRLTGIEYGDNA